MPNKCLVCASSALEPIESFSALPRVTSDCKPWPAGGQLAVCGACGMIQKLPTAAWFAEIGRIYGAYEIYHLSKGVEQPVFSAIGAPVPRSQVLVRFALDRFARHGAAGKLIDIGCGNGAAIADFSARLPGWTFDGHELSDHNLDRLRQIRGFRKLHLGSTAQVADRYDVVTLIHSLEHMAEPGNAVAEAVRLMTADGTLFIEVPNAEASHFDVLVADHLCHFTPSTLAGLAASRGIAIDVLRTDVVPKEVSLIGRRGTGTSTAADPAAGRDLARRTVSWLESVLDAARAASRAANFGLFGSSVSAMWLYGALRERVAFFVDEDKARAGSAYEGRPVLPPAQIPDGATVFVPLVESVATPLLERLSSIKANFILPPAFPA